MHKVSIDINVAVPSLGIYVAAKPVVINSDKVKCLCGGIIDVLSCVYSVCLCYPIGIVRDSGVRSCTYKHWFVASPVCFCDISGFVQNVNYFLCLEIIISAQ